MKKIFFVRKEKKNALIYAKLKEELSNEELSELLKVVFGGKGNKDTFKRILKNTGLWEIYKKG